MPSEQLEEWADKVVADEVAALGAAEVPVVCHARSGPAAAILMEASEGADLLVVGTSGHGRITGLLLGSVSQFLAVHAPCPVVIVHGPRHDGGDPAADPAARPAHLAARAAAGGPQRGQQAPVPACGRGGADDSLRRQAEAAMTAAAEEPEVAPGRITPIPRIMAS